MIRLQIIKSGNPTTDQLERLKQYASVPTDSRDALLMGCLQRAMIAIQEAADAALLPCTFSLTITDVKAGETFSLYAGGEKIIEVKDQEGHTPSFMSSCGQITIKQSCQRVVIKYENAVLPSIIKKYEPVVWQYATALYDGEDFTTLQTILNQATQC